MLFGMHHRNFKHLPWIESIEVARPTIYGFHTQISPFLGCFFAVFSGNAHELMVPAKPNMPTLGHTLMQEEPTDLLNLSRCWTISGVQNVSLYYKIDTNNPIVLVAIQTVTGPRAIQNTRKKVIFRYQNHKLSAWPLLYFLIMADVWNFCDTFLGP